MVQGMRLASGDAAQPASTTLEVKLELCAGLVTVVEEQAVATKAVSWGRLEASAQND